LPIGAFDHTVHTVSDRGPAPPVETDTHPEVKSAR